MKTTLWLFVVPAFQNHFRAHVGNLIGSGMVQKANSVFCGANLWVSLLAVCLPAIRVRRTSALKIVRFAAWFGVASLAVVALLAQGPAARITGEINNTVRVIIPNSHPPMARAANDRGRLSSGTAIQGMSIVMLRSNAQEAALQKLIAAQQNSSSAQYHKWLTPDQFANQFGLADADIAKVQSWLEQQGFTVEGVARSKNRITFSGTAEQVETAFGTELHSYAVGGETHYAPSSDVSIPAALSSVVQTVGNLSSFRPRAHVQFKSPQRSVSANFTSSQSGNHYLTPKDVATIYDINSAYNAGYTGTGQSSRSDHQGSDGGPGAEFGNLGRQLE
jgi:hypothetical protein